MERDEVWMCSIVGMYMCRNFELNVTLQSDVRMQVSSLQKCKTLFHICSDLHGHVEGYLQNLQNILAIELDYYQKFKRQTRSYIYDHLLFISLFLVYTVKHFELHFKCIKGLISIKSIISVLKTHFTANDMS